MIEFDNYNVCHKIINTVKFPSFENKSINKFFEDLQTYNLATVELSLYGDIIQIEGDLFFKVDDYLYQSWKVIIDRTMGQFILFGPQGSVGFKYANINLDLNVKIQEFAQ